MDAKEKTLIDAVMAEPKPELTPNEIGEITMEIADPESTVEKVMIGGKAVQVRFLTWKYERKMLEIIAPYCRVLIDGASVGAFEETLSSLLVEAQFDLTRLAVIILTPQAADIGAELDGQFASDEARAKAQAKVLEEWIDDNARFEEIVELVKRQIAKNKLADSLGKLWAPGVLAIKTLRILDTLPLHLKSLLQSNSIQSAPATD